MRQPLDLGAPEAPAPRSGSQSEFQLKAEAPEPAPQPARRRPITPEPAPAARPAATGSTLFERMSNLSRGVKPAAPEESDEDDSGSISIPRFLGRQNNQ